MRTLSLLSFLWLLLLAPDIYLAKCRAIQCAFNEDEARASAFNATVDDYLDDLLIQAQVAEYGAATLVLDTVEPQWDL